MNWILIPVAIAIYEIAKKNIPQEVAEQMNVQSFPIGMKPPAETNPSMVPATMGYMEWAQTTDPGGPSGPPRVPIGVPFNLTISQGTEADMAEAVNSLIQENITPEERLRMVEDPAYAQEVIEYAAQIVG